MPEAFSPAEAEFEQVLRDYGFMTASLKEAVKAPSIEDNKGLWVTLPDILAIDTKGGQGWCFEVKDETTSSYKMQVRQLGKTERYGGGYAGPVWLLERHKTIGYRDFSAAFDCPCVIAVHGDAGWRAGFFTCRNNGLVDYNTGTVAEAWEDWNERRIPVMYERMLELDGFMKSIRELRSIFWR